MPEARINYAPETCASCGGSGSTNGIIGSCHVCGGTGWVHVID